MSRYKLERTHCRCHVETCSCSDWTITKDGEIWCKIFDKDKAGVIVSALNIAYDRKGGE